jgi:hypothetical protein
MIDEKLYQLATDELNSDKRKPDIWARACALASNDHDEARYLYTNLRVEQMITEQAKKDEELVRGGGLPDATLNLDDDTEELPPGSSPVEISTITESTENDSTLNQDPSFSVETDSTVSENEVAPLEAKYELDPEDIAAINAAEPGNTSAIDGKLDNAEPEPENKSISMDENPLAYWAQQHQQQLRASEENQLATSHANHLTAEDSLSQELERQANELPGQQTDVISYEEAISESTFDNTFSGTERTDASSVHYDYADSSTSDHLDNEPTVIPGSGKRYQVYSRKGRVLAVKDGVSWPAMLFTLPWLLTRCLFGTAIVYALLWIVIIAGLLSTGFAWLDAAPNATQTIKLWTLLFAALAVITLLYVPFRHGNKWVATKLEKRGFKLDSLVYAKNRKKAVDASINSALF